MKTSKVVKRKPAATKKSAKTAKPVAKAPRKRTPVQAAAGQLAERGFLAKAIADLAAITRELRAIAKDLRDMVSESGETGSNVESVVIAEVENPEAFEEES